MRKIAVLLSVALTLFGASAAIAATTLYTDSSNFGGWPNALNPGNSVGPPDGLSATVPNGGWIAFQESSLFSTGNTSLTVTSVTGSGNTRFYVGRSNGAGWFSALNNRTVTLTTGVNILPTSAAQSAFCTGIGGCDVFVVQAFGGTTFALDAALGPSPEPSAWALMILGFVGVAGRLKVLRQRGVTPSVGSAAFA